MQPYYTPTPLHDYGTPSPIESGSSTPNFLNLPTPTIERYDSGSATGKGKRRATPGTRGPAPSSCEGCRRLRSKCVRRNPNNVGEEDCLSCIKKGIECRYPKQIARPRTSNALLLPPAEDRLVSMQLSGELGSRFFETYLDHSRVGFEENIIPLLVHDCRSLQGRYYSAGKRIDQLEPADQLRSHVVFAASSRRLSLGSSGDSSAEILDQTQQLADRLSIWRTPSYDNLLNLLLLFHLVAKGNIGSPEADHYLSAACTQFRHIFVSGSAELAEPTSSSRGWAAYTIAIVDIASALERRVPPYLSNRDFLIFTQGIDAYDLPPPHFLLNALPASLSRLLDQCVYPLTYYIRLSRDLAIHFSQPDGYVTLEQDVHRIQATFRRLDVYTHWWEDCMTLLRSQRFDPDIRTTAQASISLHLNLGLILEFLTRDILERRVGTLSSYTLKNPQDAQAAAAQASINSLLTLSSSRCEQVLCPFLRQTRNRNGIYLLASSSGQIFSVNRLGAIASTLCNAPLERYDLFPVGSLDKLASVTFLLKTVEIAKIIYPSSNLDEPIALLKATQLPLEAECGYSGEMALILVVSTSTDTELEPSTETHVPNTPTASLLKITELIGKAG